jgi:flagellin
LDGANILDGTIAAPLDFLANANATETISLSPQDMTLVGLGLDGLDLTSEASADAALTAVTAAITTSSGRLAELGAAAKQIERHTVFVSKLSDSLESGIGNLVDADLAKESARLQALQVQQQLGVQALSIANQAPQVILSLFQG